MDGYALDAAHEFCVRTNVHGEGDRGRVLAFRRAGYIQRSAESEEVGAAWRPTQQFVRSTGDDPIANSPSLNDPGDKRNADCLPQAAAKALALQQNVSLIRETR